MFGGGLQRKKKLLVNYVAYSAVLLILYIITHLSEPSETLMDSIKTALTGICYSRYAFHVLDGAPVEKLMNIENSPLWFLTAMFLGFVLCSVVCSFTGKNRRKISVACVGLLLISVILSFIPVLLPWSLDTAFIFSIFIFVGLYLQESQVLDIRFNKRNLSILCFLMMLYVVIRVYNGRMNISLRVYGTRGIISPFLYLYMGIIGSYFCVMTCKVFEHTWIMRGLSVIGKHTLVIMSLHMVLFYYFDMIFGKYYSYNDLYKYVLGYLKNVIVLLVCVGISKLINYAKKMHVK